MVSQDDLRHVLMKILPRVAKPTRYTGGEWNAVVKPQEEVDVRVLLAFPDVYDVGMSYIGFKILYSVLNKMDGVQAERAFAPWVDMEEKMREHGVPLYGLETFTPAGEFDIIGFTLQYEMAFTNILNMLDLSGIPLRSKDRNGSHPLIIAGGPVAYNVEPVAEFFDAVVIGEGETVIIEIVEEYRKARDANEPREALIRRLADLDGVYVPKYYDVEYNEDGTLKSVTPNREGVRPYIRKRIMPDLDESPFPEEFIVPYMDIVHDRIALEIQRGCTRGCRFCQAGMIYRPVRERSREKLKELANKLVRSTGYEELSLLSLSSADYSQIQELTCELVEQLKDRGVAVSLPSLRADAFSIDLAKEIQRVRKTGLTFAPEAGTQRLRNVINKGVTEENLFAAVSAAFEAGWYTVKLYFMIGLPTETDEDLAGIVDLAERVLRLGRDIRGRVYGKRGDVQVNVAVSSLVPKPHTPFQWFGQNTREELKRKQEYIRSLVKARGLSVSFHDVETSFLEAVLSRGDRRLCAAIEQAWKLGCRFDSWEDRLELGLWYRAFEATGIDPTWYANRDFGFDEVLPWDHIRPGVTKKYLKREWDRAMEAAGTVDCRTGDCEGCGVCTGGIRVRLAGGGAK